MSCRVHVRAVCNWTRSHTYTVTCTVDLMLDKVWGRVDTRVHMERADSEVHEGQVDSSVGPGTEGHEVQVVLDDADNTAGAVEKVSELQTKLGRAIQRAVEDCQELVDFDSLHRRLRIKKHTGKRLSRDEIQRHQHTMTLLHARVSHKKVELSDLTKQFF